MCITSVDDTDTPSHTFQRVCNIKLLSLSDLLKLEYLYTLGFMGGAEAARPLSVARRVASGIEGLVVCE